MSFTTGGNANWVRVAWGHYDKDSAKSEETSSGETSWLETTVQGEGTIRYYRKFSSGVFEFFVDSVSKGSQAGSSGWVQYEYNITGLGPHTLRWSYYNDGSGGPGEGFGQVDYVQWDSDEAETSYSLQQALDAGWPIVTGGDEDWLKISSGSHYGGDCAESGTISDEEVSQMEATVEVESDPNVTFWWKVSSESSCDYLQFYIDGEFQEEISGEVDWEEKSYSLTGSGTHSLLWQYIKDVSTEVGSDCGWVDYLQGPGSTPPLPDILAEAVDSDWSFTTGGNAVWVSQPYKSVYDSDAARSGSVSNGRQSWMQTTVTNQEGVSFFWKVSSEEDCDYLEFYIDGDPQDRISGEVDWHQMSYSLSTPGSHTLKWKYVKDGSDPNDPNFSDFGWVDWVHEPGSAAPPRTYNWLADNLDSDLIFTTYGDTDWGTDSGTFYYGGDSAKSGWIDHDEESCLQSVVYVANQETISFYWKVSSEEDGDYLEFYIDDTLKDSISGEVNWQKKSYDVSGADSHTLKWVYVKNSSVDQGDDCGWVDCVQWTGSPPIKYPDPADWDTITYEYDPAGRRIKKTVDDKYTTKYCYDGGNVIAEYDGNNKLLRKYIYGARVDEPVCMIDVVDNDAVYYYHFDGLGSVVALSDSDANTVQTYEYSIYGQVAASEPEFLTNPYMFTGRRFDIETGLYYYRARYYNPHIGRFMQTDPVGYNDGINWYRYCGNNPLAFVDPSGASQIVTGRYWIIPNGNNPDTAAVVNAIGGVIKGIMFAVDFLQPGVSAATEVLEAMATKVGAETQTMWRAFIEVRDCCDTNSNRIIEEREKTGDPYWIEVTQIGSGGTSTGTPYDQTAWWLDCYYHTWRDAADAAGTAINWAHEVWPGKQPPIAGVIPEDTTCLNMYLYEPGDPYGYDRYGVDEDE